jgi:CheY-like chemotaxis protein
MNIHSFDQEGSNMLEKKNLNILIAEDDADDADFIREIFSSHESFQNVEIVKNGKELVDYFIKKENKTPDIILTDINMPLLNGFQALEEISKMSEYQNILKFVYSTSINPSYKSRYNTLNISGWITKPFSFGEFRMIPAQIIEVIA